MIEHNGKKELVVSADGLKDQLDSSAVYQKMWLIKGDQPIPAGAFKTDNKGEGTVTPMRYLKKEASESWEPWQSLLNQKE
ncbi:anti-sigma factor [Bacillus sp. SL00103]